MEAIKKVFVSLQLGTSTGMKLFQLLLMTVALLSVNAHAAVSETASNGSIADIKEYTGPEKAVWDTTQTLLNIIEEERESYKENPSAFYDRVAVALEPVVGFRRIAAMVMGKYYKKASKPERQEFSNLFKTSLVETYSGGLIEYDGYKISIKQGDAIPEGKKTAVVDVVITTSSGTAVPLKYSMYRTKAGLWKVQNVTVAGINVGLLYRQQFARKVAEASGDISAVVSNWSSRLEVEVEDGEIKTPTAK